MPASRPDALGRPGFLIRRAAPALLLGLLATTSAHAQTAAADVGAPTSLLPAADSQAPAAVPVPPAAAIPATAASAPQQMPPAPVQFPAALPPQPAPALPVQPLPAAGIDYGQPTAVALPAPTADSAGALGPDDNPLPPTLWQGTPRATVDALLPLIAPTPSPALQDLAYRLLASPAQPPQDDPTAPAAPGALNGARVELLTEMGRSDAALTLIHAVPKAQMIQDAGQVAVDLAFLDNDVPAACGLVTGRDSSWQNGFWDEAQVTCQVLNGQTGPAQAGLDVLNDAQDKNAGFLALVDRALGGNSALPDTLPAPQPLSLALIAKAGKGIPYKALDGASLSILRAFALTPGVLDDARLIAAEKAAAFGALPAAQLGEAYLALPIALADTADPMTSAEVHGDARGRAILYAAARNATDAGAKANFLAALFKMAAKAGLYQAVVAASASMLDTIPPEPPLKPDAADIARALYTLDRPAEARRWFDLAPPDQQAGLMVLAHIVGGDTTPDWGNAALLPPATNGNANSTVVNRAALAAMLLNAEGTPAPDSALLPLLADNTASGTSWPMPAAGPPLVLDSAAAGNRMGATVLAVLATLGSAGVTAPPPLVAKAVLSLREIGLITEARHLAIDAAIAAGA
jgi:hypothetical protein